ncbi:hypothetical protein [Shewanella livingstonensis]|uniref:Uncharacterized protein n=1 Tax=Shewanella livingstonensis TaxID=150120 RepID=A0A3G8LWX7_9GAMM|nr:hypothetical protein [Shewanella livingstonensis]AZG74111.1 hypothetical protein EGC82_15935 [Shewanella livingstonensis]
MNITTKDGNDVYAGEINDLEFYDFSGCEILHIEIVWLYVRLIFKQYGIRYLNYRHIGYISYIVHLSGVH